MYFTQIKSYWLNNKFMEKYDLKWSKLRTLGHNSIIKSSYIWLIIVPLAAKIFSTLPEVHTFKIFEANITVHFGLPFSWIVFYFMALFFAIGQFIYSLKCPEILKNYANFSDYEREGNGNLLILKWLEWLCYEFNITGFINLTHNIRNFLKKKLLKPIYKFAEQDEDRPEGFGNTGLNDVLSKIELNIRDNKNELPEDYKYDVNSKSNFFILYRKLFFLSKDYRNDWFYAIANSYEKVNLAWLKASAICFGLGFFFFTIIAIQNLWFVIKAIF